MKVDVFSPTGAVFTSGAYEKEIREMPQGITFFMRTRAGTTGLLRKRQRLPVLVEASYGPPEDLALYHHLICIAGGVGITAVLTHLRMHTRANGPGSARLYWGNRSRGLVHALHDDVSPFGGEIAYKTRLDIPSILRREFERVGEEESVAIVVSGPKSMADEVRRVICEIGKSRKGDIKLVDEAFGW